MPDAEDSTVSRAIVDQLESRRRALGMSLAALAKRSGVSLPTVRRILAGEYAAASFANVVAVAHALGADLRLEEPLKPRDFKKAHAQQKARRLVGLVQGTQALEAQAVDSNTLEQLVQTATRELLHSKRLLWG